MLFWRPSNAQNVQKLQFFFTQEKERDFFLINGGRRKGMRKCQLLLVTVIISYFLLLKDLAITHSVTKDLHVLTISCFDETYQVVFIFREKEEIIILTMFSHKCCWKTPPICLIDPHTYPPPILHLSSTYPPSISHQAFFDSFLYKNITYRSFSH